MQNVWVQQVALLLLRYEGPVVPDVRDASDTDRSDFDSLIDSAYELWLTQPIGVVFNIICTASV